jgi:hypothetical protein
MALRRFRAKPDKKIVDGQAASPSSWKTPLTRGSRVTLDCLGDAELRRQTSRELNKGETRNSLARAVFIRRLGEIRDRTYENQKHRASGLNVLVTAIILWNTRYLEHACAALRQIEDVPDRLLAHLSPLGWEHVSLTGDYIWSAEPPATERRDGFRPLRTASDTARKAA